MTTTSNATSDDKVGIITLFSVNMHAIHDLVYLVAVWDQLIYPYPSGLLHWHWGNHKIAPVPVKQPWRVINGNLRWHLHPVVIVGLLCFVGVSAATSISWSRLVGKCHTKQCGNKWHWMAEQMPLGEIQIGLTHHKRWWWNRGIGSKHAHWWMLPIHTFWQSNVIDMCLLIGSWACIIVLVN